MTLSSYLRGGLFGTFSPSALDTAKSWAADPPMIEEQRGTLVPGMIPRHVAGEQPSTQLAVPGILHDPYMAMARLFDAAGAERAGMSTDDRQNARDAFDVAGLAATGGLVAPKPTDALGIFGGRLAKTADHAKLAQAEEMLARGVPREDVWRDTGWFKGSDGGWLHDVPGAANVSLPVKNGRLINAQSTLGKGDLISHQGAVDAYPHIAEMPVKASNKEWSNYWPGSSATEQNVTIGESIYRPQWQRGIADGNEVFGSPSGNYSLRSSAEHELDHAAYAAEGGQFYDGLGPQVRNSWPEVRARAAEKRMDLTPEQRAARPPWLDYDVPEAQQIVRFGNGGPQMSIEPPKPTNSLGSAGGRLRGYRGEATATHPSGGMRDSYWASSSSDVANSWANGQASAPSSRAPNITPVDMTFKNPLVLNHASPVDYENVMLDGARTTTRRAADEARRRGHDGIVINNVTDNAYGSGAPATTYAALQPGTVRSATTGELLFSNPDTASSVPLATQAAKDLPMDQASRLARAREMGFDTDRRFFRGTTANEVEAKPNTWIADNPSYSNSFANGNGGNVMPLVSRGRYAPGAWSEAEARAAGFQGREFGDGTRQVFSPSDVRSVNAAFDPAKSSSANLLAANPLAAAAFGLLPPPENGRRR